MITNLVVGKKYRLIGTSSWGNPPSSSAADFPIGKMYECVNLQGLIPGDVPGRGVTSVIQLKNPRTHQPVSVYLQDLADGWSSRKEHAAAVKEELTDLKKTVKQKELEYERLSKYDSDEEEIASLLVTAMSEEGDPKERVANLAKLLKGRLRTDIL